MQIATESEEEHNLRVKDSLFKNDEQTKLKYKQANI